MKQSDSLKDRKLPLGREAGSLPALGFGTLIPDATETRIATKAALEAGFRHLDCAERYRNEEQVGEAIRESIRGGLFARGDLFVTTKLWNSNECGYFRTTVQAGYRRRWSCWMWNAQ